MDSDFVYGSSFVKVKAEEILLFIICNFFEKINGINYDYCFFFVPIDIAILERRGE